MTPGELAELERLVTTLCDHRLDAAEQERLETLLRGDAECRRAYLAYVDLHVRLMHHPRLSSLLDDPPRTTGGATRVAINPRATPSIARNRWRPIAATAALTLAASLVVQAYLSWRNNVRVVPDMPVATVAAVVEARPTTEPSSYVATLTKTDGCVWGQREPLRAGMRIVPGELVLASGKAELQFDGGATLVLEGPARLEVESVTSAAISGGKVLFTGDASSEPFNLRTPQARLVDYGTEYAVVVADSEELHVFDGEVRRTPNVQAADGAALTAVSVSAGQARRFESPTCTGRPVPLDPERLRIRACAPPCGAKPPGEELLAYEPFQCDAPTLPCDGGGNGGLGWAGAWTASSKAELRTDFRLVGSLWRPQMAEAVAGGGISVEGRGVMSRRLARPVAMDADGVYYFSFLALSQRRSGGDACDLQLVLRDDRNADPCGKLAIGISWSSAKASFCCQGGGNCASLPLEYGKTYLLAGKIVCSREHSDQAFLRLYAPRQAVDAEEPSEWTVASRPIQSDLLFNTLHICANTKSPAAIDEIRLGTTWRAVAGIYAPSPIDEK